LGKPKKQRIVKTWKKIENEEAEKIIKLSSKPLDVT